MSELAWAAGFFDGEGNVNVTRRRGRRRYLKIQSDVAQIDRDVLDRFCAAVGAGRVYGPYARVKPSWRPLYSWHAHTVSDVRALRQKLGPFLSAPKREQLDAALVRMADFDELVPSNRNSDPIPIEDD